MVCLGDIGSNEKVGGGFGYSIDSHWNQMAPAARIGIRDVWLWSSYFRKVGYASISRTASVWPTPLGAHSHCTFRMCEGFGTSLFVKMFLFFRSDLSLSIREASLKEQATLDLRG
jgi:hypothetical protein